MLPRSCLRLADSKSNSSTRLPRRTTTRVSSGWVASISILLAIAGSLGGWPWLAFRTPLWAREWTKPVNGRLNGCEMGELADHAQAERAPAQIAKAAFRSCDSGARLVPGTCLQPVTGTAAPHAQ